MLEDRLPSGPDRPPMNFASSGEPSNRRGVWQSAQCAAPPARYCSPRQPLSRRAPSGRSERSGPGRESSGIAAGRSLETGFTLFR